MSFSCPNHVLEKAWCTQLKQICVPGRAGCLLEGKVRFAVKLEERIALAEQVYQKMKREE